MGHIHRHHWKEHTLQPDRKGPVKKRFAEPDEIMAKVNESFDRYSQKERKELFDFFKMLIQRQRPTSDANTPLSYDDDSGVGSDQESDIITSPSTRSLTCTHSFSLHPISLCLYLSSQTPIS